MKKVMVLWFMLTGAAVAQWVPIGVDTNTWMMKPLGTTTPGFTNYYNQLMWQGVYLTGNSGGNFALDNTNLVAYVGQAIPFRLSRIAGTENPAEFAVVVSNSALASIAGGTSVYFAATSATTQTVDLAVIGVATGTTWLQVSAAGYGAMQYVLIASNAVNPTTLDSDYDGISDQFELNYSQNPEQRASSPYHSGDAFKKASLNMRQTAGGITPVTTVNDNGRFSSPTWTVECYVFATNWAQYDNGIGANEKFLIQYGATWPTDYFEYQMGVSTQGLPYIEYCDVFTNHYSVTSTTAIATGQWIHIAGSLGGSNDFGLSLRVNGYTIASKETRVPCAVFDGELKMFQVYSLQDNVRMWNRALTQTEASANLWRTINTPSNQVANGLMGEWRFDERPVFGGGDDYSSTYGMNSAAPLNTNLAVVAVSAVSYQASTNFYFASEGEDDADNDGLPNWFEEYFGVTDPRDDPDGDGVDNYTEFVIGTNPKQRDTDGDAIEDGQEDLDQDGLANAAESLYGCRPDLPDTDDDGLLDGRDVGYGASYATNSRLPASGVQYSLILTNTGAFATLPDNAEFRLGSTWTLQADVWFDQIPTNDTDIIARIVDGKYAYALGMYTKTTNRTNAFPGVKFQDQTGARHVMIATNKLVPATYYNFAATRAAGSIVIYLDGNAKLSENLSFEPAYSGLVASNIIGRGLVGALDSVYIGDTTLSAVDIRGVRDDGLAHTADWVWASDWADSTNYVPVSSNVIWTTGHLENYSSRYPYDWTNSWHHGGDLAGAAFRGRNCDCVEYVTTLNPDGEYSTGNSITCRVRFARAVAAVYGTPSLALAVAGGAQNYAYYVSAGGFPTNDLLFVYTITSDDITAKLDYGGTDSLSPDGGWILNANNQAFDTTLPVPGTRGSIAFDRDISINLFGQAVPETPACVHVSATNANATYTTAGQEMLVKAIWPTNYSLYVATGEPYITLDMIGTDRAAVCKTNLIAGPTNILHFAYEIQSGDLSTNSAFAANRNLNYLTGGVISSGTIIWSNATGTGSVSTNLPTWNGTNALGQSKAIIVTVP